MSLLNHVVTNFGGLESLDKMVLEASCLPCRKTPLPLAHPPPQGPGLPPLCGGVRKKHVAAADFSSAVRHFAAGISFLHEYHWADQYELSLVLFECSALAHYAKGNHE